MCQGGKRPGERRSSGTFCLLEGELSWKQKGGGRSGRNTKGKKKTLTWAQTPTGVVASVERNTNDRSGEGLIKKKGRAEGDNEAVGVERM